MRALCKMKALGKRPSGVVGSNQRTLPCPGGRHTFGMELAVISDHIINAIKQRISPETGLIRIDPAPVRTGDKVKIFDGPLAGLNGIVHEKNSEQRSIILMKLLGRPTKVEVDTLIIQKTS